jgi:hypothetical protein
MGPLGSVGRLAEFQHPYDINKPIVKDSRFGIRNLPKSDESPSIFSYANPGRGANGESQT